MPRFEKMFEIKNIFLNITQTQFSNGHISINFYTT